MLNKLMAYRKHNPFEMLENDEEKLEMTKKYLDKYYYISNYSFIISICILSVLLSYILFFKGLIPIDVVVASLKNTYTWETIVVSLSYFGCTIPAFLIFIYLSDKCVTLRLYAEETYEKLKNNNPNI